MATQTAKDYTEQLKKLSNATLLQEWHFQNDEVDGGAEPYCSISKRELYYRLVAFGFLKPDECLGPSVTSDRYTVADRIRDETIPDDELMIYLDNGDFFFGTLDQFGDCYFTNPDMDSIVAYATDNDLTVHFGRKPKVVPTWWKG